MKYFLSSLFAFIILAGCNETAQKSCNISILNNTTQKLNSVKITSYGLNAAFTNLLPNEKVEKVFQIDYFGKYEGAFLVSIFVKDSIKSQVGFGYYSNSSDIKSKYFIEILPDFSIKEK